MRTRKRGIEYIEERQRAAIESVEPLTPSVQRVFRKMAVADERSMLGGALSTRRLYDLHLTESSRKPTIDGPNKQVQRYGEIYRFQAKVQIKELNKQKQEVVNIKDQRELKTNRKLYARVMKELLRRFK
jgi:hypothetical protein